MCRREKGKESGERWGEAREWREWG